MDSVSSAIEKFKAGDGKGDGSTQGQEKIVGNRRITKLL